MDDETKFNILNAINAELAMAGYPLLPEETPALKAIERCVTNSAIINGHTERSDRLLKQLLDTLELNISGALPVRELRLFLDLPYGRLHSLLQKADYARAKSYLAEAGWRQQERPIFVKGLLFRGYINGKWTSKPTHIITSEQNEF